MPFNFFLIPRLMYRRACTGVWLHLGIDPKWDYYISAKAVLATFILSPYASRDIMLVGSTAG